MLISTFVDSIRSDFRSLSEIGGTEVTAMAERLGAALEPAIRKHFLDSLNDLVQEFNVNELAPLTLNLEGDKVHLVKLISAGAEATTVSPSDYSARIALRLSDDLKENIEHLATDVGSSVNSWIVRTLERSVRGESSNPTPRNSRQLRGKGRA